MAVLTFYDGNIPAWVFHWNSLACISSGAVVAGACTGASSGNGAGGWSGYTDLTLNTEFGVGYGDASAVSYSVGGYNLIGVVWNNNIGNPAPATNRIRFAVESMSNVGVVNFPVSITLSYYEYTNIPSVNYQVTPSNYFTITYSVCNEVGCSGTWRCAVHELSGGPVDDEQRAVLLRVVRECADFRGRRTARNGACSGAVTAPRNLVLAPATD